jgi:hypothetical protein
MHSPVNVSLRKTARAGHAVHWMACAVAVIECIRLHFFHILMDELDRHCAFTDSRSDALCRA